jgi:uncharacterized membrane protein YbhN (UPF0104 family)
VKRSWLRAGRVALGVGLLAVVLLTADLPSVVRHVAAANLWLVIPAVAGLAAVHVVAALGWRSIVGALTGADLALARAVRAYYAAQALGGITPANLGGDLYRAAAMRAGGHGWGAAVLPIVVQRATSYAALGALGVVALAVLAGAGMPAGLVLVGVAAIAIVGVVAIVLLVPPPALAGLHRRLVGLVGGAPSRSATSERERPGALRGAAWIGLGNGAVFHALGIGLTWAILVAVDPSLASLPTLAAVAVARLSLAIPISPSGIGLQEGALAALVAATGGPVDAAVAGMLMARLGLLLTTGVGALCLAFAGPGAQTAVRPTGQRP